MRYVVTGLGRSGTSMMMHCLHLGGMECVFDPDYWPYDRQFNPDGYYEVQGDVNLDDPFYDNKVVKRGIRNVLCSHPLTAILMLRNQQAVLDSRKRIGITTDGLDNPLRFGECNARAYAELILQKYTVVCGHYETIVANPLASFQALKEKFGLPIDPEAAASGVRLAPIRESANN